MDELIDLFSTIKNTVYKHNQQKYDLETIFKTINECPETDDRFKNIYIYVTSMKNNLESIGTKIIEIQKFADAIIKNGDKYFTANQNALDELLKSIFKNIDDFIDSITAFSRIYQAKGQEFDFIRTIMELRAKRDLLMKLGNEYSSRLIKGKNDSLELQFFLNDFLDSIINESYRLQINKILKAFRSKMTEQDNIEELW